MSKNSIPDQHARQSALDISRSFLVQAPAGSGKTELLTQRFLKLLAYVETPEEIIAITFTNKAAAEMHSRIIAALEKVEKNIEPTSDHERVTDQLAKTVLQQSQLKNWHLREHPNRLRILTMDALSLYIAQKLPISSRLGAQLDIAEDPQSLYQQATKMILLSPPKNAPWLAEIKTLLLYLDNDYYRLESLLITLLSKRDQWLPLMMLGNNNHEKRRILESELAHVNEFVLQAGENLLPDDIAEEIDALTIYAKNNLNFIEPQDDIEKQRWLFVANMLLTKADELRKKADKNNGFPPASTSTSAAEKTLFEQYKQRFQTIINVLAGYPEFIAWLIDVRKLPETQYTDIQWQVLSSLLTLLPLCAAQLRLIFSQYHQVDYIENAQSALQALGTDDNPTDISLSLDYKIQHILVDEFQDTSSNQFQLLEKLTAGWMPNDGHTLFLVGDPMQSIYRFRQAEVGLFLHAKHLGIGQVKLTFISLSSNFRSTTQLVNWTNAHFKSIFPQQENIRLGAIPYSAAYAIKADQKNSQVECVYFLKDESHAEEQHLVEKINTIKKNAPTESIVILIRSRDHLQSITPLLQSHHIEYQAVDIETLSHEPIIHDLFSLTRACIHLGDRVAWLACLRAPWCGLTLQDLWTIAHSSAEKTIWELLLSKSVVSNLNDDAQARLLHFSQAMTFAIQQRQRISLRDIVEKTWQRLGGKAWLSDENQRHDVEKFFEILEKIVDPIGVIQLDILERKIEKLFAATQLFQANPVQIMTIHKAKGLEFDHVFLPKLHKKTAPLDRPLISWLEYPDEENIHHLLMAPLSEINASDKTYDYIQKQQQKKLLLEMDRVLYVATTRAKKCLYLSATLEQNEVQQVIAPKNDCLLGRLWETHPKLFQAHTSVPPTTSLPQEATQQHSFHRVTLSALQSLSTATRKHEAYLSEQKNSPTLVLAEHREEAKMGEVIHLLIEHITEKSIDWWQSLSVGQQEKIIDALKLQFNLVASSSKIHRAIKNIIDDPRGQWILKKRDFALSEYIVYSKTTVEWQKRIIDRIFQDEDGQYWIIDFKTSENHDSTLSNELFIQQAAKKHQQQLQSYQQAISQAFNIRNIQLALYFPLLPAWMVYPN